MKGGVILLWLGMGFLAGFSLIRFGLPAPATESAANLPAETKAETRQNGPVENEENLPAATTWQELLSDLPDDRLDGLLELAVRVDRYPDGHAIRTLFEGFSGELESIRKLPLGEERLGPAVALLAARWAGFDAEGMIEQGIASKMTELIEHGFRELSARAPEEMATRIAALPENMRVSATNAALPALMRQMPLEGLRIAEEHDRERLTRNAYWWWMEDDAIAAMNHLLGRSPSDRSLWMSSLVDSWARSDHAAALAWVSKLADPMERTVMEAIVLEQSARVDPLGAAAKAVASGERKTVGDVARAWAEEDAAAALGFARGLEDRALRQSMMMGVMESAARSGEVEVMLSAIKDLPVGQATKSRLGGLLSDLAQRDLPKAVEWLRGADDRELLAQARENVLTIWVESDARAASRYVDTHPDVLVHDWVAQQVTAGLAEEDPEAALAWASGLPHKEHRDESILAAVTSWSRRDPQSATAYAASVEEAKSRERLLTSIGNALADRGGDVSAWLNALPDEDRALQSAHVARGVASQDPEKAFALLAPLLEEPVEPSKEVVSAVVETMNGWADYDAVAVAEWALSQSDARMREGALKQALYDWGRQAPGEAEDFVRAMDPGPDRDVAASVLALKLQSRAPEEAWNWASSIGDAEQRDNALKGVLSAWATADLPAALAVLESAELAEDTRASVLRRFERHGYRP